MERAAHTAHLQIAEDADHVVAEPVKSALSDFLTFAEDCNGDGKTLRGQNPPLIFSARNAARLQISKTRRDT